MIIKADTKNINAADNTLARNSVSNSHDSSLLLAVKDPTTLTNKRTI